MKPEKFNQIVEDQFQFSKDLLTIKGSEYAAKNPDRLAAFKKAAAIVNSSPKQALLGMLTKHLVSISDMCLAKESFPISRWNEKITDSINYLLLLKALVMEETENEQDTNKSIKS